VPHAQQAPLLLFIDADTRHSPWIWSVDCARAASGAGVDVEAGQSRDEDREYAVQPCVFVLIPLRHGGARSVNLHPEGDVVANGQCFMLSRATYDAIGGHRQARRDFVAEDVMMAQTVWTSGRRVAGAWVSAAQHRACKDGLGELVKGWGRNVYALRIDLAMRGGPDCRARFSAPVAKLSAWHCGFHF
jgi:hypothetical protein